jgi:spermidine/putrescine transport system ATP-binding protein
MSMRNRAKVGTSAPLLSDPRDQTEPVSANPGPDGSAGFLELEGLSKRFGERSAVEPTTLDFCRGEFVTLLGPSGCGKTTLLRMIAGFEKPTSGDTRFRGRSLRGVPPERRPFNMVFQSYALFPHLNVFENVAYGLRSARLPEPEVRRRVMDALTLVGLGAEATLKVDQLSGGMSQRVALVRALVRRPEVLLLDEPLGALDLQLRKRMQVELREIQRQTGATFIYVTHDQEEALVMSKRVVIMQHGRVVQVGAPADVYRLPQTRFAAEFIGTASMLPAKVVSVVLGGVEVEVGGSVRTQALLPSGARSSADEQGVLAVRPEDFRVLAASDEGALGGKVVDGIFLGQSTHLRVKLPGLGVIRAQWRGSVETVPTAGEQVAVELIPFKATFLPAE